MSLIGPHDLLEPVISPIHQARQATISPLFAAASRTIPQQLTTPLGLERDVHLPPVDPQYQRNLTSLTNKYSDPEIRPTIASLSTPVRNALFDFDAQRVARGTAPLTRRQTLLAAMAAETGEAQTPAPKRNPLNLLDNVRKDLGDVLRALPQLPMAMVNEIRELPQIPQQIAAAERAGASPLQAFFEAPGIRMVPGAYAASRLSQGAEGVRELASHPLMTFLDVLPIGHSAAARTATAQAMAKQAQIGAPLSRTRPRPISAVLMNRLGPDGVLQRRAGGQMLDTWKQETRPGQLLDSAFGTSTREVMRAKGKLEQRIKILVEGHGVPDGPLEAFLPQIAKTFEKHAETYPQLRQKGPEAEAFRAQVKHDFERGNIAQYDPSFVADYRNIVDGLAKYTTDQNITASFRGEIYTPDQARLLRSRESAVQTTERVMRARNEYISPSGTLTGEQLLSMLSDALADPVLAARNRSVRAVTQVFDAYGYDIAPLRSATTSALRTKNWASVREAAETLVQAAPPQARRSVSEILTELKRHRKDRQITLAEAHLAKGNVGEVSRAVRNLRDRKPATFPDDLWPAFNDDIRSASRRMDFDEKMGRRASEARLQQQRASLESLIEKTPPARFDALLADELQRRIADQVLPNASPEQAGALAKMIQQRRWDEVLPDMPQPQREQFLRQLETDVKSTWQLLRDNGHDPIFVHKVSPGRAAGAVTANIDPVPALPSQGKQRALDLSPQANDLQLSLTHQGVELLEGVYRERFVHEMIDLVGRNESQLRGELADLAMERAQRIPSLDFEGHLQQAISRGWERFNPDQAGHSWGGVKLDKYRQEAVYIPKGVAENLHRLSQTPSLVSRVTDPLTNAFRYNVIGLSPSIIINNFFSNSIAVMAESGLSPFKYWSQAREWLRDPSKIPVDELKGIMSVENPAFPHLNRQEWMRSHGGQKVMEGFSSAKTFYESSALRAVRAGKSRLDGVAEGAMRLQQMGDNIYRGMVYMDEVEKLTKRGLSPELAAQGAVEQVRRVLIDYASFTSLERQAIRSIIPFYSYMAHAIRYITRYPMDHPVRTSIMSHMADAERDRLGGLPATMLAQYMLGSMSDDGSQTVLPTFRLFNPFGDISDMLSVSGWMAATNPLISTMLQEVGVHMGEPDLYPTLRYDEETGRMKPVQGGFLGNLIENTIPRIGIFTSLAGINPRYNDLLERDPGAATRSLMASAGLPRPWRDINIPQEHMRAELNRMRSADTVRNQALKSGDWSEAARYPSLQVYLDAMRQAPPESVAAMTPHEQEAISQQLRVLTGVG